MDVRFVTLDLPRIDTLRFEAAVACFFETERPLRGAAGLFDWRMCGRISRAVRAGHLKGTAGEVLLVPGRPRLPFDKLLLFGLGSEKTFGVGEFHTVVQHIVRTLTDLRLKTFVVHLPGRSTEVTSPVDAIRWFLATAGGADDQFEEVLVLEDPEAQRAMAPIVDVERRRAQASLPDRR